MQFDDLPREFLRAARSLLGLDAITLFVPTLPKSSAGAILIHEGAAPAPPELCDVQIAQALHESREGKQPSEDPGYELVSSSHPDCSLFRLSTRSLLVNLLAEDPPFEGVDRRSTEGAPNYPPAWVGIRRDTTQSKTVEYGPKVLTTFAGLLAWQVSRMARFQRDPLTGLADRTELQARLTHEFSLSRAGRSPISLLLVNPDHFGILTERVGRAQGDIVLGTIASRLSDDLREEDLAARFGSAIFAVVLPGADSMAAAAVGRKIHERLSETPYTEAKHRLTFSLGMATFNPSEADLQPSDLILRADQAMILARRSGGDCGLEWQEAAHDEAFVADALSSVYTGEAPRDARNMLLLSELVKVVSTFEKPEIVACQFVERLYSSMSPERVALFDWDDAGALGVIYGRRRSVNDEEAPLFSEEELKTLADGLLEQARSRRRYQFELVARGALGGRETSALAHVLPLLVGGSCIGCIYFEEADSGPGLDSTDLQLLRTLTSHLAAALGRAQLVEIERAHAEKQRQQLVGEVEGLRQAISETSLPVASRSSAMENVLSMVQRVAPADVTVLLTGESGVGKGVVAKTVHELSSRREAPLVVVDCASIPPTLIESELFGHEKGAFTGAQQRRAGRLREAHGGTLFLDEIGELPVEVQGRLLRFVQERTVSPVGSTSSFEVDVRIIAATNRDLKEEVRIGNFREDLFYRLNVVPIRIPPLRRRREDISDLVESFLQRYCLLYNRASRPTVPAAVLERIEANDWPGNIRELENRVQQAVVLGGVELTLADFGLSDEDAIGSTEEGQVTQPLPGTEQHPPRNGPPISDPSPQEERTECESFEELLGRLTEQLRGWVRRCREGAAPMAPLGIWLESDLIFSAHRAADGINQRAAARVGLPGTTFKRRYVKAKKRSQTTDGQPPAEWREISNLLDRIVELAPPELRRGLVTEVQEILLSETLEAFNDNNSAGARVIGVTAVTYRRRARTFRQSSA